MKSKRVKIIGLPESSVNQTIKPVSRENANLEAEKGERTLADMDGDGLMESYDIGGEKHYNGGTPLNLPENSFIYSDDKKLKIKDPDLLREFGFKGSDKKLKKGYTPAEIHKKFDNNKHIEVLKDEGANKAEIRTATMMLEKNAIQSGKLALYQEAMKGFENGVPMVAQPYFVATEMDPSTIDKFIEETKSKVMASQGQSLQEYVPEEQYFKEGGSTGIPKFALAGENEPGNEPENLESGNFKVIDHQGKKYILKKDGTKAEVTDIKNNLFIAEGKTYKITGESSAYRPEPIVEKYSDLLSKIPDDNSGTKDAVLDLLVTIDVNGGAEAFKENVLNLYAETGVGNHSGIQALRDAGYIPTEMINASDEDIDNHFKTKLANMDPEEMVKLFANMEVQHRVNDSQWKDSDVSNQKGYTKALKERSSEYESLYGLSPDSHGDLYGNLSLWQIGSSLYSDEEMLKNVETGGSELKGGALKKGIGSKYKSKIDKSYGSERSNTTTNTAGVTEFGYELYRPVEETVEDIEVPEGDVEPLKKPDYEWWQQDINNLNRNLRNQLNLKKYLPFEPDLELENVNPTFTDFRGAAQAAGSVAAKAMDSNFGLNPGQVASRNSQIQGQLMDSIASSMMQNQSNNVGISNQFKLHNNQIDNRQAEIDYKRRKSFHDGMTTANQQFDNSLNALQNENTKLVNTALTNAAETYNQNLLNRYYHTDASSGGLNKFVSENAKKQFYDEGYDVKSQETKMLEDRTEYLNFTKEFGDPTKAPSFKEWQEIKYGKQK